MKKIVVLFNLLLLTVTVILVGCGEPDVYDMMEKSNREEIERRLGMTQEERDAEDQAEQEAKEEEERQLAEKWKKEEEQKQWELDNTDEIYYKVSRYSPDKKFIEEGKFVLVPISKTTLEQHKFHNRGYSETLDNKAILVEFNFFDEGAPDSKFDIYRVIWKKGNRSEALRAGIAYRSISRGW